MPVPRKYDDAFIERALEMYDDRRRVEPAEAKIAARRQVGGLLDLHEGTLRKWVESREGALGLRGPLGSAARSWAAASTAGGEVVDMDEVRRLRREKAELKRVNDILKTASAFFAQAQLDRRLR